MRLAFSPTKALRRLLIIIGILLIANLIAIIAKLYFPGLAWSIMGYFDFDRERNIPTFFSALILMICGILLWIIGRKHKNEGRDYILWLLLAFIFVFLSFDEIASLHEILGKKVRVLLDTKGIFHFAWVIPYGIGIIVFFVVYLRFLFALPKKIMKLFVLSGTIFVFGAIGMELPGGWYSSNHGEENWVYCLIYTFEELLEMIGAGLFVYTLLTYITIKFGLLEVVVKD